MIGTFEVVESVIALVKAASPSICSGRIYTHVKRGTDGALADQTFPFIHIDNIQHIVEDVQCQDSGTDYLPLHVWSRYEGAKECLDIFTRLHSVLHNKTLSISGMTAYSYVEDTRVMLDTDGKTFHGIFSVMVNQHTN